jgi:hypothetical protein
MKALYSSSFFFHIAFWLYIASFKKGWVEPGRGIVSENGARNLRRYIHQRGSVTDRHNAHGNERRTEREDERGRASDGLTSVGRLLRNDRVSSRCGSGYYISCLPVHFQEIPNQEPTWPGIQILDTL